MPSEPGVAPASLTLRPAERADVPLVLAFIRELAEYERLASEVVATEPLLDAALFGERRVAEALIAELDGAPAGFALFFPNFSTFLARPGIYLEDLYVRPPARGRGVGRALLAHLARLAVERGGGRLEWAVLNWNDPAIGFYETLGARRMAEWSVFRLTGEALARLGSGSE
jgi:GNAT superfamily N-acetyltransferase